MNLEFEEIAEVAQDELSANDKIMPNLGKYDLTFLSPTREMQEESVDRNLYGRHDLKCTSFLDTLKVGLRQ
jgi:hypothetical protein